MSHPLVTLANMNDQMVLEGTEQRVWRLDRRTREIGRRGLAEARETLRRRTLQIPTREVRIGG